MGHTYSDKQIAHAVEQISLLSENDIVGRQIWRVTKEKYHPLQTLGGEGRWNVDGQFVLYCSFDPEVAKREVLQSIPDVNLWPKTGVWRNEVKYVGDGVLDFTNDSFLGSLGLDRGTLTSKDRTLCQKISGGCERMGTKALIVPSAVSSANNVIFYLNNLNLSDLMITANLVEVDRSEWALPVY